jgi:hydroxysqualene dehydroxylase
MSATVHIIGAGIAGLTAAAHLAEAGRRVVVYETGPRAGGRCRSFADAALGRTLDNGSHMVLSGNRALLDHARRIGGTGRLRFLRPAVFPFRDLRDGAAWALRPGGLWLFDAARRVPGTSPLDYLPALKTLIAGRRATAAALLPPGTALYERLWETLIVSALNGPPERVSARLFGAVLRETLLKGEAYCRPVLAPDGLAAAFVDPALAFVSRHGGTARLGCRVDALEETDGRVTALSSAGERVSLAPGDSVILAVPPQRAAALLPGLAVPPGGAAIVNAHFRLDGMSGLPETLPFLGLIGGTAEWLFQRGDVLSVTVSNADALAKRPADEVAARLWADAARALGTDAPMPPVRVIKEKRATFDQSPEHAARRPGPRTRLANLFLAGDWTATGLPATLEGAARSGECAAKLARRRHAP